MDWSLPGSSVQGILQARIERVVVPSSRGSSQPRDWIHMSMSPALADRFFTTSATWEAPKYELHTRKSSRLIWRPEAKLEDWALLSKGLQYVTLPPTCCLSFPTLTRVGDKRIFPPLFTKWSFGTSQLVLGLRLCSHCVCWGGEVGKGRQVPACLATQAKGRKSDVLPRDYPIKWSKSDRQRQIPYDVTYIRNLKKWHKWTYLQNRNKLTDIENKLTVTRRETWGRGIN